MYKHPEIREGEIYAVKATFQDRDRVVGYVIDSRLEDIEAYFKDKSGYGLRVEKLTVLKIPPGTAGKLEELNRRKEDLLEEIKDLERQIAMERIY